MNKLKFILHQILRQKLSEDNRASLRVDMITPIKITKENNSIKKYVKLWFLLCMLFDDAFYLHTVS